MNISQVKQEGLQVELKVVIPAATIAQKIREESHRLANVRTLKGFRKGKVPMQIMRAQMATTLNHNILSDQVQKGIEEITKSYKIYGSPTVSDLPNIMDAEGQDVSFSVSFEQLPEISTPDLQVINIEKPVLEITATDIQAQIQKERRAAAIFEDKNADEGANSQDVLLLELVSITAAAVETNLEFPIATYYYEADGHVIFKDQQQFSGRKAGEELSITTTVPEEIKSHSRQYEQLFPYIEQQVAIGVKIIAIKKMVIPAIDDAQFLNKLGCKDVAAVEEKASKYLQLVATAEVDLLLKIRLFNQLEQLLNYQIPHKLLEREVANLKHYLKQDTTTTDEQVINKLASRRARIALFITHYAEQAKLEVDDNDLRNKILEEVKKYPQRSKEIVQFYTGNKAAAEQLANQIIEDKVVAHMLQKVKLVEVPTTKVAFEAMMAEESTI